MLLAYDTNYAVTVTTGAQDLAGNPMSSLFTSSFRTGKAALGPATPGEPDDAVVMSAITGTITDPGVTFTFTLTNGRSFTFTGTVTNSNTMTGTMSGATLAPIQISLTRGG